MLGRISSPAPAIVAAIYSVRARLIASSRSPSATSTGARIDCSWASAQLGSVSHILQEEGEQGTMHGLAPFLCPDFLEAPHSLTGGAVKGSVSEPGLV